jgi:hypothetical protein
MAFFYILPEVAGELGPHTVLDTSTHPPIVSKLHYAFHGWLGDAFLTSFPCYIVTTAAADALRAAGASGIQFGEVEVSTDYEYEELYPNRPLPPFVWLQVSGKPGKDDFGMARNHYLVLSERALQILSPLGIAHAHIAPFVQDDGIVPETLTSSYIVKKYLASVEDQ